MSPTPMQLIPAIDLLQGRCVRLLHGDFEKTTFYDVEPAKLADRYADAGAEWLHVVDLDASRFGAAADTSALFDLLKHTGQRVQTGGGVRGGSDIHKRLLAGVERVVVGSLSVTDTPAMVHWLEEFGADKLVAALDVSVDAAGKPWPRIHGWTRRASKDLWQLLDELATGGLEHLLCTDIDRDGALGGPNLDLYREITQRYPQIRLQASGGISSLADIEQIKSTGASAVITGKALLEDKFGVADALAVLKAS